MKDSLRRLGLVIMLISISITVAYGNTLYEEVQEEIITKGVTRIHHKLLWPDGWRNVNVLKINLEEKNVRVAPIQSATGTQRQTVSQMVKDSGAVAGVNGDYFDMSSSYTPSLGMVIKDGQLQHSYNSQYYHLGINKNMATFMIDYHNRPDMAYYGVSIKISSNGHIIGAAGTKNIIPASITRPIIVDNSYYQTTHSIVGKHKTVYTLVVENNVITYRSKSGEGVTIPKEGFVVIIPQSLANTYYAQLTLGAPLKVEEILYLNQGLTDSVEKMKLGIGGSGLIMKNGEPYKGGAHSVTPASKVARTIVATVKGTQEILLITVDKSGSYLGMNQSEILSLLKTYKAEDAMYLDGGGSTTFVSRHEGSFTPSLQNYPSGGKERKVVNGLGVFTTSPVGHVASLRVTASTQRSFVGQPIRFNVKAVDSNYNPVTIQAQDIQYKIDGITGTFTENIFVPTSSGKGVVTATLNGISEYYEVSVEDKPSGIIVEPCYVQIPLNGSQSVKVYGVSREGYKIPLSPEEISWQSSNPNIKVTNQQIVGGGQAALTSLTATYKGISSSIGVVVGSSTIKLESFEKNSGKPAVGEKLAQTTVFPIKEIKYEGQKSLKMTYTFKTSSNKQVASTIFNQPIIIPEEASSINMWLYGKNQGDGVKVQLTDAKGKVYSLQLVENIAFNGWKYTTVSLPEELSLPAKMTKINVYTNGVTHERTSAILMDHISVTRGLRGKQGMAVRADYLVDASYKPLLQEPIGMQYMINVIGPTLVNDRPLSTQYLTQLGSQLSKGATAVIQASWKNSALPLTTAQMTYKNGYEVATYNDTKVMMIGTGSGGIRTTDVKAWPYLQASIEKAKDMKHLIIVMNRDPLTQFTDKLEGEAFHQYLAKTKEKTGQNIFVIYPGGTCPEVKLEDGIRYIRVNGMVTTTGNYEEGSFVKFKMDGEKAYYSIESFR